jgi:peptidase E
MKLLLTSNGFMNTSLEKDFLEMTHNKTNLKVAVIPTAGDPIEWVEESAGSEKFIAKLVPEKMEQQIEWLNAYRAEWEKRGCSVIIADLKEDPVTVEEKLENVDVIDVLGGDVNWLLDWSKKSKLDIYLKDMLNKGVVYVGTSAGSMLVNPDIGFTWWAPVEKWEDTDHVGLGIIDFMFQPLHGETDESTYEKLIERKKYLQTLIPYPWNIYLVKDGQAIKVVDKKVEHIGLGKKESI